MINYECSLPGLTTRPRHGIYMFALSSNLRFLGLSIEGAALSIEGAALSIEGAALSIESAVYRKRKGFALSVE